MILVNGAPCQFPVLRILPRKTVAPYSSNCKNSIVKAYSRANQQPLVQLTHLLEGLGYFSRSGSITIFPLRQDPINSSLTNYVLQTAEDEAKLGQRKVDQDDIVFVINALINSAQKFSDLPQEEREQVLREVVLKQGLDTNTAEAFYIFQSLELEQARRILTKFRTEPDKPIPYNLDSLSTIQPPIDIDGVKIEEIIPRNTMNTNCLKMLEAADFFTPKKAQKIGQEVLNLSVDPKFSSVLRKIFSKETVNEIITLKAVMERGFSFNSEELTNQIKALSVSVAKIITDKKLRVEIVTSLLPDMKRNKSLEEKYKLLVRLLASYDGQELQSKIESSLADDPLIDLGGGG